MALFSGFNAPGTLQPSEIKNTDPIWGVTCEQKITLARRGGAPPGNGIPINYDLYNSQGGLIAGVRQVFPQNTYNNRASFYFNIVDIHGNTLLTISRDTRQVTNILMPAYHGPSYVRNIGCCVRRETGKGNSRKLLAYSREAQVTYNPDSVPKTFAHIRENTNGFSVICREGFLGADIVFTQPQLANTHDRTTISATFKTPHQGVLGLKSSKELELTPTQRAIVLAQAITFDYDGYGLQSYTQSLLLNQAGQGHLSYQDMLYVHYLRYQSDPEYRKTVDQHHNPLHAMPHQLGFSLR